MATDSKPAADKPASSKAKAAVETADQLLDDLVALDAAAVAQGTSLVEILTVTARAQLGVTLPLPAAGDS